LRRRVDETEWVRLVRALPHWAPADRALALSSKATDHGAAWIAGGAAAAAVHKRDRGEWLLAWATVTATEYATKAIKRRIPRDRPHLEDLPPLATVPSPRSFPSSHTADAVAGACVYAPVAPHRPWWPIAGIVAFSRIYLGVHYPSDVAAGALIGLAVATAVQHAR
jgi:membrane-associated phospholipid phosphatase